MRRKKGICFSRWMDLDSASNKYHTRIIDDLILFNTGHDCLWLRANGK